MSISKFLIRASLAGFFATKLVYADPGAGQDAGQGAVETYSGYVTQKGLHTRVFGDGSQFIYDLDAHLKGTPAHADQLVMSLLGYSAAGYASKDGFNQAIESALRYHLGSIGGDGRAVILTGGTSEGIGQAVPIIDSMRQEFPGILLGGVVSEQAVKYPDSIEPSLQSLFLVPSYSDGENQSWAVQVDKNGPSYTVLTTIEPGEITKIATNERGEVTSRTAPSATSSRTHVMLVAGGGAIALEEALEYLAGGDSRYRPKPILHLVLDQEPGNPKKDKGPRGADMIYALLQELHLVNTGNFAFMDDFKVLVQRDTMIDEFSYEDGNARYLKARATLEENRSKLEVVEAKLKGDPNNEALIAEKAALNAQIQLANTLSIVEKIALEKIDALRNSVNHGPQWRNRQEQLGFYEKIVRKIRRIGEPIESSRRLACGDIVKPGQAP